MVKKFVPRRRRWLVASSLAVVDYLGRLDSYRKTEYRIVGILSTKATESSHVTAQ